MSDKITNAAAIKIAQVCAKCGDEFGTAGYRYIDGTRYCGPCARAVRDAIVRRHCDCASKRAKSVRVSGWLVCARSECGGRIS